MQATGGVGVQTEWLLKDKALESDDATGYLWAPFGADGMSEA